MQAMILAAGRGERMRPLSDHMPKPLLEVRGKPLIVHLLESLVRDGFADLVINHAWLGAQIECRLGNGADLGARIRYSPEPPGALETGGGLLAALSLLDDAPFLVVSGDVWTDYPFAGLRDVPVADGHLVMVDNPPYKLQGDFRLDTDAPGALLRRDGPLDARLTYANIAVLSPRLLRGHAPGRFPLGPLLFDAAERGALSGEHYHGAWFNIGTPQDLQALDAALVEPGESSVRSIRLDSSFTRDDGY